MIAFRLALARESPKNNEPGGLVVKHWHTIYPYMPTTNIITGKHSARCSVISICFLTSSQMPCCLRLRDAASWPTMTTTRARWTCFQEPSSFMRNTNGFSARSWYRKTV